MVQEGTVCFSSFKTKISERTKYTWKYKLHAIIPLLPKKGKLFSHLVDYVYIEKDCLTVWKVLKLQLKGSWKEKLQTLLRPTCKDLTGTKLKELQVVFTYDLEKAM